MRFRSVPALVAALFVSYPGVHAQQSDVALVRHAPSISGTVDGSIQQVTAEDLSLTGAATVTGSLLLPGNPSVVLKDQASIGSRTAGTGSTNAVYQVTLAGSAHVGTLRIQVDPVSLPSVAAPPSPTGTQDLTITSANMPLGNLAAVRNLAITVPTQPIAIPPGSYGNFSAVSGSGFKLGVANAPQPAVYNFQQLSLAGTAKLEIIGRVVINLAAGETVFGTQGQSAHPDWLIVNVVGGDFVLNSGATFYGYVNVPTGAVTIGSHSHFTGGSVSDRLSIGVGAILKPVAVHQLPTVALTAPVSGTVFVAPTSVTLQASASAVDGTVTKVEFFAGHTKLGEVTTAPYRISSSSLASGVYSLTAKVTDNTGATGTSAPVTIRVNTPPRITLTAPANGTIRSAPASLVLRATATDSDGSIAKVEFFSGATKLAETRQAPYEFEWTAVPPGTYALSARATDNLGAATTSATANITVNPAPGVTLTAPLSGTIVPAQSAVTLQATATSSGGTVTKVEFFRGSTKLGGSTAAPFQYTWASVSAGTYTLTAKATDNHGGVATSSPVTLIADAPPVVAIDAPSNGAVFVAPASVVVKAHASAPATTVAKVEFFSGATKIGEAAKAPYQVVWKSTTAGTYVLTAKATDVHGGAATSAAVTVTVDAPPVIALTAPAPGTVLAAPATTTLQATANDRDGAVVKVDFYAGSTKLGTATAAPFQFVWQNIASGTYALTARATDNKGAVVASAPVSLRVVPSPVVKLTAPVAGTVITAPASVVVKATATTTGATIAQVEFFSGVTSLGVATKAPFQVTWTSPTPGTYSLTAKATDSNGLTGVSAPVSITINAPPTVALTSPTSGSLVMTPATLTLQATASDSDGTIAKVEFYRGTTKLGESTASPYQYTWSNIVPGTYSLTAKAADNQGGAATSMPVTLIVDTAPVVALTTPAKGTVFTAPANILVHATASDSGGTIAKVEFFAGSTKIGEAGKAPYQVTWAGVTSGTYLLTARATDANGVSTTSAAVNITVNAPPTVSLTAPITGTVVAAPATVVLQATASDSDGSIAKVEFFRGTTKLGESTSAPYQFTWANAAPGTYTLTAKATDNLGAATISAPVSLVIDIAPTVQLTSPLNGQSFSGPANITLAATANDRDGTIKKVEFFNGATNIGEADASPFQTSWLAVPAGSYVITAKATDNAGLAVTSAAATIQVTSSNTPPTVAMVSPTSNTVVGAGGPVTLTATATSTTSTIASVAFFSGATKLGDGAAVVGQPGTYSLALTSGLNAGTYSLTARATDATGAVTTSASVTLIVDAPPTVALTAPAAKAVFAAPGSISLTATASDADGTVVKVEFFNGTAKLGESTAAPYHLNVVDQPAGVYVLTAVATDDRGMTTNSVAVTVYIDTAPTVTFSAPASGTIVAAPSDIVLQATATDPDGTVAKVEFFNGPTKIGETSSAPYQLTWPAVQAGTYTLTARATDNLGVGTTSPAVTITLDAPPTVALTAPAPSTVVAAPGSVTLTATASDADGTVAKVEFFYGTTKIGESATAPYQFAWTGIPAGSYTVTAVATDDQGFSTASTPVTFLVDAPPTNAANVQGGAVTLAAPAQVTLQSDTSGSASAIDHVEVYRNGVLIGNATVTTPGSTVYSFTDPSSLGPGIYTYRTRVYDVYGFYTDSTPIVVTVLAGIPYTTDFEPADGFTAGSLNGQLGWLVTQGAAQVTTQDHNAGTQSVVMPAANPPAQISQAFATPVPLQPIMYVDFYTKPVAAADVTNAATFDLGPARLAFLAGANGQATLQVLNSDGQGGGVWAVTTFTVPIDGSNQAQAWVHLTARLDFVQKTWDVYAGGKMILSDQGFRDNTATNLSVITVQGATSGSTLIDTLQVGTTNPLFADVNNDGIDDAWEVGHGLSLSTNDRQLSPSGNGVTVVQAYIAGTDPNDYYNGVAPGLSTVSGDNQYTAVNQFTAAPLVVLAVSSDGTTPLVNAPVKFTVAQGGGLLATTNTAGAATATDVTVLTGSDGTASVYYQQSNAANVVSQISAAASSASITFTETSVAAGTMSVAAGQDFSLALKNDGTVWAWGHNGDGQLGVNATTDSPVPVQVAGLPPVSAIAGGAAHALALAHDGSVWAWGRNVEGQLGNGTGVSSSTPVQVFGLPGIVAIAAGTNHSLALDASGNVWAWGYNADGELGNGAASNSLSPIQVPGLTGITAIAGGGLFSVALKNDGTVWVWGYNTDGELGNGTTNGSLTPVQVTGLVGIVAISAGDSHALAVKADGSVWAWGFNQFGQLGNGSTTSFSTPAQVLGVSNVVTVTAGGSFSLAQTASGALWGWGSNEQGQLADAPLNDWLTPAQLGGPSGVVALSAGRAHALFMKADGSVFARGDDSFGQLGNGASGPVNTTGVAAIAAGAYHEAVVANDGTLWTAWLNSNGQLGDGTTINRLSPVEVPSASSFAAVAAGVSHTLALGTDGTIWAWGGNDYGQLGDGTTTGRLQPVQLAPFASVVKITAGAFHSVAVADDGIVWTWGSNLNGQLGDGTTASHAAPAIVAGISNVTAIAAGDAHTLALRSDGSVWSWGANNFGQLGDGTTDQHASPIQVPGITGIVQIAAGNGFSVALGGDGTVWVWGTNAFGQLGDNTLTAHAVPHQVSGLSHIQAIAAGAMHVLALKADGTVVAWGGNQYRQVGDGTMINRPAPVAVSGVSGVRTLSAGVAYSMALLNDGTVRTWGNGSQATASFFATTQLTSVLIQLLQPATSTSPVVGPVVPTPTPYTTDQSVVVLVAGGNNQLGLAGHFNFLPFSVAVWSANGAGPIANAPVTFAVSSGTGLLAATSGGAGTASLTVQTDANGSAQVFFLQPSSTNTTTQVSASVGSNAVAFTTTSVTGGIAAGAGHNVLLRADGTVWTWGDNSSGELGNGTVSFDYVNTPTQATGLTGVVAVSAGAYYTLALRSDGTVWAWGWDRFSQLGNGNSTTQSAPVQIQGLSGIVAISAGQYYGLALRNDGTVWEWGDDSYYYEMGDPSGQTYTVPAQLPGVSGAIAISAGITSSLAVLNDGSIIRWGYRIDAAPGTQATASVPTKVDQISGAVAAASGYYNDLVLKSDGTVWIRGDNSYGQLGDGTNNSDWGPFTQVPGLPTIVALSARGWDFIAVGADGSVWEWGYNYWGVIANQQNLYSSAAPVRAQGVSDALTAAAGADRDWVVRGDGSVIGWGNVGSLTTSGYTYFATGGYHIIAVPSSGVAMAWGWNGYGQLGDGTTVDREAPATILTSANFSNLAAGTYHSLATDRNGGLWAWGHGLLGDGVSTDALAPIQIPGVSNVRMVAAGGTQSFAFSWDGTLWGWGYNSSGQVGDGTTTDRSVPVPITVGLTGISSVAAGRAHSAAIDWAGAVWTWGDNSSGQLGIGSTVNQSTAVQVQIAESSGFWNVAAGDDFTLALANDGTVWAWGNNAHGQLGDDTTTNRLVPIQVSGLSNVTQIVAGGSHAMALLGDGTVWAWGSDQYRQLGDGGTTDRYVPQRIAGLANVQQIGAGETYSVAELADGSVVEWGNGATFRDHFYTTSGSAAVLPMGLFGPVSTTPPTDTLANVPRPATTTDYNSGVASTLAIAGGDGQLQLAGQFNLQPLSTIVWTASGTGPVTNAPVTFSVSGGGALLALSNDGTAAVSPTLTVNTDASGLARVYFLQPSSPGVATTVTASSGAMSVTFTTHSLARALAIGSAHVLALRTDGTVWSWGRNAAGQLGDGTTTDHPAPAPIPGLSGVIAVAASGDHSLILKKDGTVWAWGVGNGGAYSAIPSIVPGLPSIVAIAAGGDYHLALGADGSVWALTYTTGTASFSPPTAVAGVDGVIAIAAGDHHFLALNSTGALWAWGDNSFGQLGNGNSNPTTGPQLVTGLGSVVAIAAGGASNAALLRDGTLWTWGRNGSGQLGNATTTDQYTPVQITGLPSIVSVAAGANHMVALAGNGSVWVWGDNSGGQLADGTTTNQPIPEQLGLLFDVVGIAAGVADSAVQKADGTVWTWGLNGSGQLGDGTNADRTPPYAPAKLPTATVVVSGDAHNLALDGAGNVWAWGQNMAGQLGDGTTSDRAVPVEVSGLTGVIAVAAGSAHSVAVKSDGTVWSWGSNLSGQLGDGTTTDRLNPVQVPGLSNIVAVAAGNSHTLAVRNDGTVWAWGNNSTGQLGDGTTLNRSSPVQVSGLAGVAAVAAGLAHSVALKSDGSIWAWGSNTSGQLGDGTDVNRLAPVAIGSLSGVTAIAAGRIHTLGLRNDGTVWAWGNNVFGQLGDGTTNDRALPTQVLGLSQVAAIRAAGYHSVAVKSDGTIVGWGDNAAGQTSGVASSAVSTPTLLGTTINANTVSAGADFSEYIAGDGTITGFGNDGDDQLGAYSSQIVQAEFRTFDLPPGTTDTYGPGGAGTSSGPDPDPTGAVRLEIYVPNP